MTLYWQYQAWFLPSSCAFQEEAGAARPGCCGGMPRALLHSHSHAWKLLSSWSLAVPGSSPACFSESTAVSGWLQVLRPLSGWHLEFSQQLLTHGRTRPLERDTVKLFFLSAARVRSLCPFHPSESTFAAAWLLFQVHLGCSVSKSAFFHTEYCSASGGFSLPCKGGHHLAGLPSRSLNCLQHMGLLLELGREFSGAMLGHFQQVWGWKLGRIGGSLLRKN